MSIIKAILKVMLHKKGILVSIFVTPILSLAITMGISAISESKVNIGILDNDNTKYSKIIKDSFIDNSKYSLYENLDKNHLDEYITNHSLEIIVDIQKGFGKSLFTDKPLKINLYYEKDSEATIWIKNEINNIVNRLNIIGKSSDNELMFDDILSKSEKEDLILHIEEVNDLRFGKSVSKYTVGMLMIFIFSISFVIVEQLLDDKRRGLTNRVKLAKGNFWSYYFGLIFIGVLIVLFEVIMLLVGIKIFRLNIGIPLTYYGLSIFLFGVLTVALSMLVGSIVRENITAQTITNLLNVPLVMIGGGFWDINITPQFMQDIAKFVPQYWTVSSIVEVQNNNMDMYWNYIFRLIILAIILFIVGRIILDRKLNK